MSTLETNAIGKYSGNNVSVDDSLNLKSYTEAQRDALTASAGDVVYNSDNGTIDFYNGTAWFSTSDTTFTTTVDYLVIAGGGGGGSSGGGIANDNTQSSDKNDDMPQTSNDMDDEIPF